MLWSRPRDHHIISEDSYSSSSAFAILLPWRWIVPCLNTLIPQTSGERGEGCLSHLPCVYPPLPLFWFAKMPMRPTTLFWLLVLRVIYLDQDGEKNLAFLFWQCMQWVHTKYIVACAGRVRGRIPLSQLNFPGTDALSTSCLIQRTQKISDVRQQIHLKRQQYCNYDTKPD